MSESYCYWSVPDIRSASSDSFSQGRLRQEFQVAREFFLQHFPEGAELSLHEIDRHLWSLYQEAISQEDAASCFGAELCLRCRTLNLISECCRDLVRRFSAEYPVTWYDLFTCLPYDDGQQTDWTAPNVYQPFTIKILQAYDPQRQGEVSLAKLAKRVVHQDKAVFQYLLDHDILLRSDWALLNRAKLSDLSSFERAVVKAFHAVYRRDRRSQHTSRTDGQCQPPTSAQLQEMLERLQKQGIVVKSQTALMKQLSDIAASLRRHEIAQLRRSPVWDSLDGSNVETESFREVADESITNNPVEAVAQKAFQAFCERLSEHGWNVPEQVDASLGWGVEHGICDRITILKRKPRRAHLADLFEAGLYLTYCQELTQSEIGKQLDLEQYQVATLLALKALIQGIQDHTVENLFRRIVQMIQTLELRVNLSTPEYKRDLIPVICTFLAPTFKEAEAERRNPKTRQMKSRLAQHMQMFLKNRRSETS